MYDFLTVKHEVKDEFSSEYTDRGGDVLQSLTSEGVQQKILRVQELTSSETIC